MVLTTKEKEYLDRFEEKKYMPELLFEDAEIVARVENHPMALWMVIMMITDMTMTVTMQMV